MKEKGTQVARTSCALRQLSVVVAAGVILSIGGNAAAQRPAYVPPPDLGDVKTAPTTPSKTAISPERLANLLGPHQAPAPKPAKPAASPAVQAIDFSHVYYDQPGDGSLWARGRTYKCSFDANGFTFVPFLGSSAPQNYPIQMSLAGVSAGKGSLALTPAQVTRTGDRVVIDRGAVQEVYLLTPDTVEQQFIFATRPGSGDVTIHLDVQSELAASDQGNKIRFGNALGSVGYSKAVTVDAQSRRTDTPTTLRNGGDIDIRLPASLLAGAAYPITVDPTIDVYDVVDDSPPGVAGANSQSDIVYDTTNDGWMVSWEDNFSATDGDVWTARYPFFGATVIAGSVVSLDFTGANWRRPRIANASAANRNLVVAEVGAVGSRQVFGRTRDCGSNTISAVFQISDGTATGEQHHPDVGGDPIAPSLWCVVWQRNFSPTDTDIFARMIDSTLSAVSGGVITVENSGSTFYTNPSISKSTEGSEWHLVYQFTFDATDEDIYATRINWSGAVNATNYAIDTTGVNNTNPAASGRDGAGNYMVVYEEDPTGAGDIYARVFNLSILGNEDNLTVIEGIDTAEARRRPSIDNNSSHFVVGYEQQFFGTDWDPYWSSYCNDASIRISEQHRNLDFTGATIAGTQVGATYGSGSAIDPDEHAFTWNSDGLIEATYGVMRNSCCRADIDPDPTGSNTIDINDLLEVINNWGFCADLSICHADIDGDFAIDIDDLLEVINGWGPCP